MFIDWELVRGACLNQEDLHPLHVPRGTGGLETNEESAIELDDEVRFHLHRKRHIGKGGIPQEGAFDGLSVHFHVIGYFAFGRIDRFQHQGIGLHGVSHSNHIAFSHAVAGDFHPVAVHRDVAVVDELQLDQDQSFIGDSLPERYTTLPEDQRAALRRKIAAEKLSDNVMPEPVDRTRVMRIGYKSEDQALTARVANAYVESLLLSELQRGSEVNSYAREILLEQIELIRADGFDIDLVVCLQTLGRPRSA